MWQGKGLLHYLYSILIWIFNWTDLIERRYKWNKNWIKKSATNTPTNETDVLYKNKQRNKSYTQINYQSNQTNYCSKAMRQRKYFRTKNKNNLDIDSYVSCLTQQNCKDLMLCRHVNYIYNYISWNICIWGLKM